ncbi:hypothetical protein D9M68_746400 [compost metagenome]
MGHPYRICCTAEINGVNISSLVAALPVLHQAINRDTRLRCDYAGVEYPLPGDHAIICTMKMGHRQGFAQAILYGKCFGSGCRCDCPKLARSLAGEALRHKSAVRKTTNINLVFIHTETALNGIDQGFQKAYIIDIGVQGNRSQRGIFQYDTTAPACADITRKRHGIVQCLRRYQQHICCICNSFPGGKVHIIHAAAQAMQHQHNFHLLLARLVVICFILPLTVAGGNMCGIPLLAIAGKKRHCHQQCG